MAYYMINEPAKAVNWAVEEEKAKGMSKSALEYTIMDCRNAEKASKGWNPVNEGYYADLASVFAMELARRNNKEGKV